MNPNEHAVMPGTPTKQPRLHSVSPPATSSLSAAQQEAARRNLLHSYVRTRGWSVSLMASESFVKNWNWGTVSQKHLYKQLCLIVLVCPPVIDIMHKYRYVNGTKPMWGFFRANICYFGVILTNLVSKQCWYFIQLNNSKLFILPKTRTAHQ